MVASKHSIISSTLYHHSKECIVIVSVKTHISSEIMRVPCYVIYKVHIWTFQCHPSNTEGPNSLTNSSNKRREERWVVNQWSVCGLPTQNWEDANQKGITVTLSGRRTSEWMWCVEYYWCCCVVLFIVGVFPHRIVKMMNHRMKRCWNSEETSTEPGKNFFCGCLK